MTIIPVEYPTQDDLERLALLDAQHKRNVRIFKKFAKFVLLPVAIVMTVLFAVGYTVDGANGVLQAFLWASTISFRFLIDALILLMFAMALLPVLLMTGVPSKVIK